MRKRCIRSSCLTSGHSYCLLKVTHIIEQVIHFDLEV